MVYLLLGVLLWSLTHMTPAVPIVVRAGLAERFGNAVYKGIFSLLIFASLALMVVGWKATADTAAFTPPAWAAPLNLIFMIVASILFIAPYLRNNIRRTVRHPQLMSVLLWGLGHVLVSGQLRSLVLFGGLAVWALLEMWLINRRDGAWSKPEPASRMADLRLVLAGLGLFAVFIFSHQALFGVSAIPTP